MNKQVYYNMMKMASLLKAAENKKKPYSALDVDTSKYNYHWPEDKEPGIGDIPHSTGGYFRQLDERKLSGHPMFNIIMSNNPRATLADNRRYSDPSYSFTSHGSTPERLKAMNFGRRRALLARLSADSVAKKGTKLHDIIQAGNRQGGDIKHKNWLKTGKIGTVKPLQITVPGYLDIFNTASPLKQKLMRKGLIQTSQNRSKNIKGYRDTTIV